MGTYSLQGLGMYGLPTPGEVEEQRDSARKALVRKAISQVGAAVSSSWRPGGEPFRVVVDGEFDEGKEPLEMLASACEGAGWKLVRVGSEWSGGEETTTFLVSPMSEEESE